MNAPTSLIKSYLVPIIALISCFVIWFEFYNLGYYMMSFTASLILLASFIEHKRYTFNFLGLKFKKFKYNRYFVLAPAISIILFLMYFYILLPVTIHLTNQPINFSIFNYLKGNLKEAVFALFFVWISAAICEEIVWRGFFMKQFIKFFGEKKIALLINVILFSVLFGYVHSYQGLSGQIVSGIIGLALSILFIWKNYDLLFTIVVHGFFDTIAILFFYMGWF